MKLNTGKISTNYDDSGALSYGTRIHLWGLIVRLLTLAIQPGISFATKRT